MLQWVYPATGSGTIQKLWAWVTFFIKCGHNWGREGFLGAMNRISKLFGRKFPQFCRKVEDGCKGTPKNNHKVQNQIFLNRSFLKKGNDVDV